MYNSYVINVTFATTTVTFKIIILTLYAQCHTICMNVCPCPQELYSEHNYEHKPTRRTTSHTHYLTIHNNYRV